MIGNLFDIEVVKKVCYNFSDIARQFKITDNESYINFLKDNVDISLGITTNINHGKILYLTKIRENDKFLFIDAPLVKIIKKFNDAGFATHACCCGHDVGNDAYISFVDSFSDKDVEIISRIFWKYDFYIKIKGNRILRWINKSEYKYYDIKAKSKLDKLFDEIIKVLNDEHRREK